VSIDIEKANAEAARARAQGEADVITTTGGAEATRTRAIGQAEADAEQALGLARAKGFSAQREAIGAAETAMVAALREVSNGGVKIVPDIQVGGDGAGVIDGLGALLMRSLAKQGDGIGHGNGSEPSIDAEVVDEGAGDDVASDGVEPEPEPAESHDAPPEQAAASEH
jgi:uncharacterized membrane protein YqiK